MVRFRVLVLVSFLGIFFTIGCKGKEDDCIINFFHSGKVVDLSSNPIQDVEVHSVSSFGTDAIMGTTDANGDYSFFGGSYNTAGDSYLYFKKNGYRQHTSESIGKGDGTCGDQNLVLNVTLETE